MMQKTALLDLDVSCIQITGRDSRGFLNRMLTNDIQTLKPDQGCYACMCNRKGKMLADLYCYARPDQFRVQCQGALSRKILEGLKPYILMEDVRLKPLEGEGAFAVIGPAAQSMLDPFFPALPRQDLSLVARLWKNRPYLINRQKRWALDSFEIWAGQADLAELKKALNLPVLRGQDAEMMRVESMTPLYGVDMDEQTIPQEAGLYEALHFKKGCYVGQETIARLENLGHVNKELCLLKLEGRQNPQKGAIIFTADQQEAGFVTSGCVSEKYGSAIALGYIKYRFRECSAFYVNGKKANRCKASVMRGILQTSMGI